MKFTVHPGQLRWKSFIHLIYRDSPSLAWLLLGADKTRLKTLLGVQSSARLPPGLNPSPRLLQFQATAPFEHTLTICLVFSEGK
ncbi:MAG TPA: hypothetical protein VH704_16155 [Casimicrobiaceae bacterium]|jgi:hypothetical protein|nr:hypothetical protein [Casimicrobiaceae bacterium]